MEGDLEPRVRRLEDRQRAWFALANHLRRGQDATNDRLDRIEGDVGTLKTDVAQVKTKVDGLTTTVDGLTTDMTELKGQVNRLEVAMARNENNVTAQFEWLRGYIAGKEAGES
jgi:septal ring factor EnvC (AmiA/AmiB activator)